LLQLQQHRFHAEHQIGGTRTMAHDAPHTSQHTNNSSSSSSSPVAARLLPHGPISLVCVLCCAVSGCRVVGLCCVRVCTVFCVAPGITDDQARQMAKGLAVTGDLQAAADQIKGLYKLFEACDCTMVEVRGQEQGGGRSVLGGRGGGRGACQARC
jgi:alkylhydroperoxidase/carboxymuconolactone decarboxylase family protein YurZ